ncbi:hypothetical protein MBLNU459_g8299t1 [Dothideomycetes sp. NU459]
MDKYVKAGHSALSQRWHACRVKMIYVAAQTLIDHVSSAGENWPLKMARFVRRRAAYQEALDEWIGQTLRLPPGGIPYTAEATSCGDPACEWTGTCSKPREPAAAEFPQYSDAIERRCSVATYRHDPRRAQRIVHKHGALPIKSVDDFKDKINGSKKTLGDIATYQRYYAEAVLGETEEALSTD